MKKTMFFVTVSIAFLLITAIHVSAGPPGTLSGTYILQGTGTCAQTPFQLGEVSYTSGFSCDLELLQPTKTRSLHYEGSLVLNKDGTGEVPQLNILRINHQAINGGQIVAQMWSGSCVVSYEYQPDGTYLLTFEACAGAAGHMSPIAPSGTKEFILKITESGSGDMLYISTIDLGCSDTVTPYPLNPEIAWEGSVSDGTYSEGVRLCFRTLTATKTGR